MTIAAAEAFIRRAIADSALVQQINAASDKFAVDAIISELQMDFESEDLLQAFINLLSRCQTETQANAVKEVKLWWDCLQYTLCQTA